MAILSQAVWTYMFSIEYFSCHIQSDHGTVVPELCVGDHSHDCVLRYPSSSGIFMLQENRAQNDPLLSTSMSPMTNRYSKYF